MPFSIKNSSISTDYSQFENFSGETEKTQTNQTSLQNKPKLPKIEPSVGFTALGCDTEEKLQRAAYMAAASRAGIADVAAQRQFADQMQERNGVNLVVNKSIELNDASVKARELNRDVSFEMSSAQIAALREFRQQYAENGGAIRFNKKPTIDLRQANTADGVTTAQTVSPNATRIHVFLKNDGRPVTDERILGQYAEDTYKGGNLWGDDFRKIGEMSVGQGVKPNIVKISPAGNNKIIDIELTPRDRAVINENYKIVQQQVNEIEKIAAEIDRNNPLSQFILGALNGIKDNLVGSATMVAHPLETLNTIKEAVNTLRQLTADDVTKIAGLLKDKGVNLVTTKEGINSIPYGAGYVVGTVATDVVIGKGAGLAVEGLKEIKPIAALLEKLSELKVLTKTKVAEMFSDEAASLASQRARQTLATTLYAGIPADVLADMAIFAGNKLKNGAVRFGEFSKQMVAEFGEKVRPELKKLFEKSVDAVYGSRRDIDLHELLGGHTLEKHVGKTEKWLRNRLEKELDIEAASSFYNKEIASRAQIQATKIYGKEFDEWAKNSLSDRPISKIIDMGETTGIVVRRGKSGVELSSTKVEVRIVKDNTERVGILFQHFHCQNDEVS